MKEKLYICVLSVMIEEDQFISVLTAARFCAAVSKEEAIGRAIECSKMIWPIDEYHYNPSVNADELSKEVVNEVYRLYPVEEKQ